MTFSRKRHFVDGKLIAYYSVTAVRPISRLAIKLSHGGFSLQNVRFGAASGVIEDGLSTGNTLVDLRSDASSASFPGVPRSEYLFVSNVRFLAMAGIVWVHTEYMWGSATPLSGAAYLQVVMLQMMKFGTIGFFLISGFLLGAGMQSARPYTYFQRRVKAVLVPWAFWGFVWFVIALSNHLMNEMSRRGLEASLNEVVREYLEFVFTKSIYWFVPNFILCIAIVLGLYRRVPDLLQGAVFLAFSLFHGANVYLHIIPASHTSALLGFVFYIWLGSFAYKHRDRFTDWLDKTSWLSLISYTCVAAVLAMVESHVLMSRPGDASNTLRVSNQAYSVLVILLIVKCKGALYPRWLKVRSETFGIFLLHPILLEVASLAMRKIPVGARLGISADGPLLISIGVVSFFVCYLCALLLTKTILKTPHLSWLVER